MDCFIDTVSLYADDVTVNDLKYWWFFKARQGKKPLTPKDRKFKENFFIRAGDCLSIRYYNQINRLFATFSLPRVMLGTNLNHAHNFDINELTDKLYSLLRHSGVDISSLPNNVLCWNPSRVDLFFHHYVKPEHRNDYLNAYKSLYLPRFKSNSCLNTHYIMSNLKKYRNASTVVRIYDKTLESKQRHYREIGLDCPELVDKDFNLEKNLDEDLPSNIIRFEVQMRRRKIKYEFCKSKSPFAIQDNPLFKEVIDSDWQVYIINDYIHKLKLNKKILDVETFRKYVLAEGYRIDKENKIIEVARHIRNQRNPLNINGGLVSAATLRRYIKELSKNGNSIITTNLSGGLKPVKYLTYRNGTTTFPAFKVKEQRHNIEKPVCSVDNISTTILNPYSINPKESHFSSTSTCRKDVSIDLSNKSIPTDYG